MPVAQCGQAKRTVLFGVFLVAHAEGGRVEQPDHGGKDFFTAETLQLQVMADASANSGQRFTKGNHTVVFCLVAYFAPVGMVAILLAPFRIAPGCLYMPIRLRTYPYIGPGGRDTQ